MALTLIVEDGTGLENSNTYISQADADEFFTNSGRDIEWSALTPDEKDIALYNATKYLDRTYADRYKGFKEDEDQALEWPRSFAYKNNSIKEFDPIPEELTDGQCEIALVWHTDKEILYPKITKGLSSKMTKVGPISKSEVYESGQTPTVDDTIIEQTLDAILNDKCTCPVVT